ncbi:MAG: hypothetical protein Unbinned4350contig1002_12 [Prokaryotic dsDNA virus sp.]|nr:MAG: hypothetical protein Unbinned4350contig1002_12 [Prokaryotic dsDNA virus sp.]|tara:strand:- start:13135 stop:13395 length:261 start_codon:yes stop_codon:yes gene_type:complete
MEEPDWLAGKAPYLAHLVTWLVVGVFGSGVQGDMNKAATVANRLPVVESRLANQARRLDRLEQMDGKLDRLAENMAAVMVELRRKQ